MSTIASLTAIIGADIGGLTRGLNNAGSQIDGFGGRMAGIGKVIAGGMAIGGAALVGLGAASVSVAAGFEQTLSGIKAVSGASGEEMKSISSLALQLGKDTSFSAKEAAAGIEELIKGGLTIPDVMNGAAKSMLDLAAAGDVTLPEAAEIAANAMAMFGLKGSEMAHAADLIAGAANASSLSVSDFKFSMAASGAIAATTGQSFDDLAQAIAIMGKSGIKGSDAGTSLKTMLMNLQPTTKKATATFRELGIITENGANQFINANGSFKSMAEIAGVLQVATKDLTDAQKLQALETMFGSDAIRAGAILAKEGASGFKEMAASMGKVTAASVGAERLNNFNGSLEQLKGSLETAGISLGLAFLPILRKVVDGFTGLVNASMPFIEKVGPAITGMVEQVGPALESIRGVIDLLSSGDFKGGIFGLAEDSPIIDFLFDVRDSFIELGSSVKQVLSGDIVGGLSGLFEKLLSMRAKIVETLAGWATAFVDWVIPILPTLIPKLTGLLDKVLDWVKDAVPKMAAQYAQWADATIDWATEAVPKLLTELGKMGTQVLKWVEDTTPELIDTLGGWLLAATDWVGDAAVKIVPELLSFLSGLLDWLGANAPTLAEKLIGEWVPAAIIWVARAAIDIIPKLAVLLWTIGEWIVTEGVPKLVDFGVKLGLGILRGIVSGLSTLGSALWDGIMSAIRSINIDLGWIRISGESGVSFNIPSPPIPQLPSWLGGPSETPSNVPGFAGGVSNFGGGLALVGEQGPELVNLPGGSDVIPLSGGPRGAPGGNIYITVNVAGSVAAERDLAQSIRRELLLIKNRNVSTGL